ncbi:MAG: DUF2752 domain-containing protein [Oscillospiraceae bacterium]|nr:DUF2752 domain-containing protein [Oscillospiraceae bacterium]
MTFGMQRHKNLLTRVISKSEGKKLLKILPFFAVYMVIAQLITRSTCIFKVSLGLPCPGCGLTRAFGAFSRLQLGEAFWWHPLFWYIPVMLSVFVFKRLKYGREDTRWFTVFMVGSMVLLIAVFAVRAVTRFPHTEPFTLNEYSFTLRIIYFVVGLIRKGIG